MHDNSFDLGDAVDYLSAQTCLTLCDPKNYSLTGFSVHEILQSRILEWIVISYSRGSSQPRVQPSSLLSPALAGRFFTTTPPGRPGYLKAGDQ